MILDDLGAALVRVVLANLRQLLANDAVSELIRVQTGYSVRYLILSSISLYSLTIFIALKTGQSIQSQLEDRLRLVR